MICIIAGNHNEAKNWAFGQQLEANEWFYPGDTQDLYGRENFHVIVVGSSGQLPTSYFEKVFNLAKQRGRMNRR
jgi:hypothetical protein